MHFNRAWTRSALRDAVQRKIEDVEIAQVTATGSLDVCGRERMGQQERHALLGQTAVGAKLVT